MATVQVRIVILTVRITLSVCPFNCMAHTANTLGMSREGAAASSLSIRYVADGLSKLVYDV
jgi:hypothetical protein